MGKIPATEFKAKCLELMDRVAERRETFVITKRGKPVAKLVPVERDSGVRLFGWLRGKGSIRGDIISPALPAEVWETLKKWDGPNARDRAPKISRGRKTRKSPRSRR